MNSTGSIQTIHELSRFIHAWYGEADRTFALDTSAARQWMPKPLLEFYSKLGKLAGKNATLKNKLLQTPFAAQNFLHSFEEIVQLYDESQNNKDYYLCFITENQGVCGFFIEPKSDSQIFCVMDCYSSLPRQYMGSEHFMSSDMEEFLIHFALQETVFFCDNVNLGDEIEHGFENYKSLCEGFPYQKHPEAKSSVCLSPDMQNLGMFWADDKYLGYRNENLPHHKLKELS